MALPQSEIFSMGRKEKRASEAKKETRPQTQTGEGTELPWFSFSTLPVKNLSFTQQDQNVCAERKERNRGEIVHQVEVSGEVMHALHAENRFGPFELPITAKYKKCPG